MAEDEAIAPHERLLSELEREAQTRGKEKSAAEVYLEIGALYVAMGEHSEKATAAFKQGHEIDPDNLTLIQSLASLAIKQQDQELFSETNSFVESFLQRNPEHQATRKCIQDIARAWHEDFRDEHRSLQYYEKLLNAPGNPSKTELREIAKAYAKVGQWADAAQALSRAAHTCSENEKPLYLNAAGTLQVQKLGEVESATEQLETLLETSPDNVVAMLLLKQCYQSSKSWEKLTAILDKLVYAVDAPLEKESLLWEAAQVYENELKDLPTAAAKLRESIQLNPGQRDVWRKLMQLCYRTKDFEGLAQALQAIAPLEEEAGRTADVLATRLHLGRIYEEELGDPDKASLEYRCALEASAKCQPALTALARYYRSKEMHEDLLRLFHAELKFTEDQNQRLSLLFRIGQLLEEHLGHVDEAIKIYGKALQESPSYMPALQALGRLYADRGEWDQLVTIWVNEIAVTTDRNRITDLRHKVARVQEFKVEDHRAAVDTYREILQINSRDIVAIGALGRLYHALGEWEELVKINLREAELIRDPKQKLNLYYKSGVISEERLGNIDMAIDCFERVLAMQPTYVPALKAIGSIYLKQENWSGLIATYSQEAKSTQDQEKRLSLLVRMGDIYAQRMSDSEGAEKLFILALQEDRTYLPALRALEGIYLQSGRSEDVMKLYASAMRGDVDAVVKGELNLRIAEIMHHELGNEKDAIGFYQAALDCGAKPRIVLQALQGIYERSGQDEALCEVLEVSARYCQNPAEKSNFLRRAALLHADKLGDVEKAITLFKDILRLLPLDGLSFEFVASELHKQQAWRDLADLHLARAQASPMQEDTLFHLIRVVQFFRQSGLMDDAVRVSKEILEMQPDCLEVLHFLGSFYEERNEASKAANVLSKLVELEDDRMQRLPYLMRLARCQSFEKSDLNPALETYQKALAIKSDCLTALWAVEELLTKQEKWQELAEHLERQAKAYQDEQTQLSMWVRVGENWEKLENDDKTVETYNNVLKIDKAHVEARRKLKQVLRRNQRWAELVETLEQEASVVTDPERPFSEAAALCRDEIKENGRAITFYDKALAAQADHVESLCEVGKLHLAAGNHEPYLEMSKREIDLSPDTARLKELRLQRALLLRDEMSRMQEAIEELRTAHGEQSNDVDILIEFAQSLRSSSIWDEAREVYEKLMDATERAGLDAKQCAQFADEMAQIHENGFQDVEGCIEWHEKALQINPYHAASVDALAKIYQERKEWGNMAAVYEKAIAIAQQDEPKKALTFHLSLGALCAEHLQDDGRAITEYNKAVQLEPDNMQAHRALSSLYAKTKEHHPHAVKEYMYLLHHGPLETDSLRALSKLFEEARNIDRLVTVYSVMDLLGVLAAGDKEIYKAYMDKIPKEPEGFLDDAIFRKGIMHKDETHPLMDICSRVLPHLSVLSEPDLSPFGVNKKDRITPKQRHSVRRVVDHVLAKLGLDDIHLYVKDRAGMSLNLVLTDPVSLIVDTQAIHEWSDKQKTFLIAKELSKLWGNRELITQLEHSGMERMVRGLYAAFGGEDLEKMPSHVQDMAKKVRKALPRKLRKELEEEIPQAPPLEEVPSFAEWISGIEQSATRAGLAICNDLPAASRAIMRMQKAAEEKSGEKSDENLWESKPIRELILYSLSEEFLSVRKELGTSVYAV